MLFKKKLLLFITVISASVSIKKLNCLSFILLEFELDYFLIYFDLIWWLAKCLNSMIVADSSQCILYMLQNLRKSITFDLSNMLIHGTVLDEIIYSNFSFATKLLNCSLRKTSYTLNIVHKANFCISFAAIGNLLNFKLEK